MNIKLISIVSFVFALTLSEFADAQPMPGTVPLHSIYSGNLGDNWTFSDSTGIGPNSSFPGDYRYVRLEGYIFPEQHDQPEGTVVPLHKWLSQGRADFHVTTEEGWRGSLEDSERTPDYKWQGIEGYIFSPDRQQPPGTIPLIKWFSPSRGDNFTTANRVWQGGSGETRDPDYRFSQLLGYAYPPPGVSPHGHIRAARRDVRVNLKSMKVNDDCDEVSDGDWFVSMRVAQSGAPRDDLVAVFPNLTDAANVETGSDITINRSVTLQNVPVTNQIEVEINAIDCDSDGRSIPGYFTIPLFPVIPEGLPELDRSALDTRTAFDCDGEEEVLELSGNTDKIGIARRQFISTEWDGSGGSFTLTPPFRELHDCGTRADLGDPGARAGARGAAYNAVIEISPPPSPTPPASITD